MKRKLLKFTVFLTIISVISACQNTIADSKTASPFPDLSIAAFPTPSPFNNSPIRKIDFKNFTYSDADNYPGFKLKNGEKPFVQRKEDGLILEKVEYLDVTNDKAEDAIVRVSIQTGGSSIPNLIYLYTLQNNKPKLLWAFMTGDRADGGFKNLYVENSELIVELFGDSKFINDEWKFEVMPEKYEGAGRPTIYTKNRFKWNGKKFVVERQPELYNYDSDKENRDKS